MKQRIITGSVLILLVLLCLFEISLTTFFCVLSIVFIAAAREWGRFVSPDPKWQWICAIFFCASIIITLLLVPLDQIWIANKLNHLFFIIVTIGVIWWLIATVLVISYPKSAKTWGGNKYLKCLCGFLTIYPSFISLIGLKAAFTIHPHLGNYLVLMVLLIVWVTDSGAYFVGRKFGKRKLIPNVSPNKTVEGLVGGILASFIIIGIFFVFHPQSNGLALALISVITALYSVIGDLVESMFKREAKLKDSGRLLPGHGGILDRIDSLTAAFPVFLFFYVVLGF